MALASKLKELRASKAQSLQQVGDAVGVSKAHIWELEAGRTANPGLELLKKLADYFQVTVAYLADDDTPAEEAKALQFFREFEGRLSEKDWEVLRNLAGVLKKD